MTLPRQRGKKLGLLLVELSYELSRQSGIIGSPERPLSIRGEGLYLSFWISRIWHFLHEIFHDLPAYSPAVKAHSRPGQLTEQSFHQTKGKLSVIVIEKMLIHLADMFIEQCLWHKPSDDTPNTLRLHREPPEPDVWCRVENIAFAVCMTEKDVIDAMDAGSIWVHKRTGNEHWTSVQELYNVKARYKIVAPVLNTSYLTSSQ